MIKSDIKIAQFASDYYPSKLDIKNYDDSYPPNLGFFMKGLVPNEINQASIRQAIIKAYFKFYILPLLFGVEVELDNLFAYKWWMINEYLILDFP